MYPFHIPLIIVEYESDSNSEVFYQQLANTTYLFMPTPPFTDIRDPLNLLVWGKTSPILAIGSYRGNLMIYNHKTSRRVPIIGKHTKAITCGAWSEGGLLALGSEDRSMSISNMDGDTLRVATLRDLPLDIQGRAE